jgi:hypothetical protein
MDDPNKQPGLGAVFKAPMDHTKTPPQLRRLTAQETYSLVDGTARQQGFFPCRRTARQIDLGHVGSNNGCHQQGRSLMPRDPKATSAKPM